MEGINYLIKHFSFQREVHSLMTSRTTETHEETPETRLKECRPCTHPDPYQQPCPGTITLNFSPNPPPPSCDTQFWEHQTPVSLFAWLNNKAILFYFSQNSVSSIQFSTSTRRPTFGVTVRWLYPTSLPLQDGIWANGREICWPHESKKRGPRLHAVPLDFCLSPKKACLCVPWTSDHWVMHNWLYIIL